MIKGMSTIALILCAILSACATGPQDSVNPPNIFLVNTSTQPLEESNTESQRIGRLLDSVALAGALVADNDLLLVLMDSSGQFTARLEGVDARSSDLPQYLFILSRSARYNWRVRSVAPHIDSHGRMIVSVSYHTGQAERSLSAEIRSLYE